MGRHRGQRLRGRCCAVGRGAEGPRRVGCRMLAGQGDGSLWGPLWGCQSWGELHVC